MWCWRRLLRVSQTARRSVNPKGNQPWIFIGRTGAEAEPPILWPPDAKRLKRLFRKDPDAGKDWRQEEKGTAEDEMAGWHHWLDGHEIGWTLGVGDGQGSLACCSPGGHKELDMTELLNWTEQLLAPDDPSIEASTSASVLSMNLQCWFPLRLTGLISLQSKGLSRVFSSTTFQKHQFFGTQAFSMVQLSHPHMITGKTISLTTKDKLYIKQSS